MRVRIEDCVAIVVDYQEKLVPAMRNSETLIRNASVLLKGLQVLEVPTYVTQQYTKGLGTTVGEIKEAMGLDPRDMESHIEKISFSAFEDIKECIKDKQFVIICGIEAHICVLQTVIDLEEAGYIPVLVTDCISSRKEEDMIYALERARRGKIIMTTYEAILFELLKCAGTEKSKKIQKLIK